MVDAPGEGRTPALRPGRGRRPVADIRRAVLDAAGEMLLSPGPAKLTFDKVAARAGVSKMTVYKWWPSPGSLAFEAFYAAVEAPLAFADTGDVRADLAAQMHIFVDVLTKDTVLLELVGLARTDPSLAAALAERYAKPRQQLTVDRLKIAQDNGQIRPEVDLKSVVAQLWGAMYFRVLLVAEPVTNEFTDGLLANLFDGIVPKRPA